MRSFGLDWFQTVVTPKLDAAYEVRYRHYDEGDFGSLDQVEFNSPDRGGEIDFWSSGWLGIHCVDYRNGDVLVNVMLAPDLDKEKDENLRLLLDYIVVP